MDHFSFTQLCRNCKEDSKTFKIYLSDYNAAERFNLSKEEIFEKFSFVCNRCELVNIVDFEQVCNPKLVYKKVWYIKRENEINKRIEEVINELLRIKIEKLKIPTNSSSSSSSSL